MKKLILLLLFTATAFAQAPTKNVNGFYAGATTINASAIGQFDSTAKGFLFPRMTTTQRNAISTPATSLIIFNITTSKYNYYDGSAWVDLNSGIIFPVTSVNTQTGDVVLTQDNVGDGTTYKQYSATEKTKLAGISIGANVGVIPNGAITGATKTKITYDSKGLVTAGTDIVAGDLPTGIDAVKINTGAISNTEFNYLDGVTSSIQTQFGGKESTIIAGTTSQYWRGDKSWQTFPSIPSIATDLDALKRDGSNANSDINIGTFEFVAGKITSTNPVDPVYLFGDVVGGESGIYSGHDNEQIATFRSDINVFNYAENSLIVDKGNGITFMTTDIKSDLPSGITKWHIDAEGTESNIVLQIAAKGNGGAFLRSDLINPIYSIIGALPGDLASTSGDGTNSWGSDLNPTNFSVIDETRPNYYAMYLTTGASELNTGQLNANTLNLQAFDVDGVTMLPFITLTAGNTPTMKLPQLAGSGTRVVTVDNSGIVSATGTIVTSVSGTTNRLTSTGGTTPILDISATFEGLLGKTANPLSQFASTTSSQLATTVSDETGTAFLVYSASPVFTGTPTAPTAAANTNNTQIATTAYANSLISSTVSISSTIAPSGSGVANFVNNRNYVAKTANYTLSTNATTGDYFVDCTANSFTITLPSAITASGRTYIIKNSGTGVITIATTSSQTIDGVITKTLNTQYSNISVFADGANYKIIGN